MSIGEATPGLAGKRAEGFSFWAALSGRGGKGGRCRMGTQTGATLECRREASAGSMKIHERNRARDRVGDLFVIISRANEKDIFAGV